MGNNLCVFMLPKLQGRKKSKGKSGLRKVNNLGCVSCDNEINANRMVPCDLAAIKPSTMWSNSSRALDTADFI